MESVILKANAKVNLTLDVKGRRQDGYHLLDMIMHSVDIYDVISIKKNNSNQILISCNKDNIPLDDSNIVSKTTTLLKERYKAITGVNIDINKNIPVGAGMAGGSADAAAVIVGLNKLFNLNLSEDEMLDVALKIGADVPFCINGGCVRATGIGEIMKILNPVNLNLLIIKPKESISTAQVYKNLNIKDIEFRPNNEEFINAMKTNNIEDMKKNMINVLETVTINEVKEINVIKEFMNNNGAQKTLMTGSGTAVFGIFEKEDKLMDCYNKMKSQYEEIFISKTVKGGVSFESWN